MIRFIPDTWADALLRPIAMATPSGNVYVEILAPDLRFIAALALGFLMLIARDRAAKQSKGPSLHLLVYLSASFLVWMYTSGNGRYFIAGLLIVGPVLIGLINHLRCSSEMKVVLATGFLALQGWVVWETNPIGAWAQSAWTSPNAFSVVLDDKAKKTKATYITLTSPTFSIIAPQFDPQSSWINLSAFQQGANSYESRRVKDMLSKAKHIELIMPSVILRNSERYTVPKNLLEQLDSRLQGEHVHLRGAEYCRFATSSSLNPAIKTKLLDSDGAEIPLAPPGFWLCEMRYVETPAVTVDEPITQSETKTISAVEEKCPRFFPAGKGFITRIKGVVSIDYPGTDMNLKIYQNGEVSYLYYSALNRVALGSMDEIIAGRFRKSCTQIAGRTGLPWDRKLE